VLCWFQILDLRILPPGLIKANRTASVGQDSGLLSEW
jgi:hypothetical protein